MTNKTEIDPKEAFETLRPFLDKALMDFVIYIGEYDSAGGAYSTPLGRRVRDAYKCLEKISGAN